MRDQYSFNIQINCFNKNFTNYFKALLKQKIKEKVIYILKSSKTRYYLIIVKQKITF